MIKTGCARYLIDWIGRGVLHGLAFNGAAAIHDLELAIAGKTSEDVGARLMNGSFGFARETSDLFAAACTRAAAESIGLGAALGDVILEHGGPGLDSSLLVAARRGGIASTVHVAVGTDIVHMTPALDGAALGQATLRDFRILTNLVARMAGGVWLNLGSAVVMPEVFLKTVSIARNLGRSLEGLTTANLDFDQKYRGLLNVLERPGGAQGIALDRSSRDHDSAVARRRRGDGWRPRRRTASGAPADSRRTGRGNWRAMKIAVFCPSFIGDTVMATPTFRAIRRGFPCCDDYRRHPSQCRAHARWNDMVRRVHSLRSPVVGFRITNGQGRRPAAPRAV